MVLVGPCSKYLFISSTWNLLLVILGFAETIFGINYRGFSILEWNSYIIANSNYIGIGMWIFVLCFHTNYPTQVASANS